MKLDSATIELITKAVYKELNKETVKKKVKHKDWRLRNTDLLLKNYRLLNKHCQDIIEDLETYESIVFDPEQLDLHALMKYKAKTKKMLNYFDSMLKVYKDYCNNNGVMAERRFKIMYEMYIDHNNKSVDDLADFWNMDRSTVFRDLKKASEELSVFLFGVDSINDLNATNLP